MTDSWTEDDEEYREAKGELLEPPKDREQLAEEAWRLNDHGESARSIAREEALHGLQWKGSQPPFHPQPHAEQIQRDIERREQLRQEELAHLTRLQDVVQRALDHGEIELESGTKMLLNISKARMALAGVGMYPGAW